MSNYWKFAEIPRREEMSFNKVLEKFYDYGVDGLVRENIQNSLDGKIPNKPHPVKVKITTGEMKKNQIPGFDEVKDHILSLQAGNEYTQETINHMRKSLNKKVIAYISFEDVNTRGLKGARNGQNPKNGDTWCAYAYNKGVHGVDKDSAVEMSRGGSHGIGKIASNSASDIYLMYFSNCDENGDCHIGGTVQLIDHTLKNQSYRSTGYFTDQKNDIFYPFENNYDTILQKKNRGLKIVVPFLRSQFNNEKEIIRSVCDNFFMAILENKLSVIINDQTISCETIKSYITNSELYEQDKSLNKKDFTPLYLETLDKIKPIEIEIRDLNKAYRFHLYFNYDKDILKGRVGIIRTIGMKIEDKRILGNVNKPYNALLIPYGGTEDAFLKSLENESHTELSWEHQKDPLMQKNAKRFINKISFVIGKIIEEEIRKQNPVEGKMNTEDILYEVNNNFKDSLSKNTSSLKIDSGKKKKTIVKTATATGKGSKKKIKKTIRKVKNNGNSKMYMVHPNFVRRTITKNKEVLFIDLANEKQFKNIDECHVHISVVDGMGKEYSNEMVISDHYQRVESEVGKENIQSEKNILQNVPINNNAIRLSLEVAKGFNRSLKYVYYVEVKQ